MGVEPTVADLQLSPNLAQSIGGQLVMVDQQTRMALCGALLQQGEPELAKLIEAWPKLPEPIRRAIAAMVQASDV